MTSRIHPTAIVSSDAQIGENVEIGAFVIIGERCTIGNDCVISPRATLERDVHLGNGVKIGSGTILGGEPQDLKFKGEQTTVEIGDNTVIREYSTINRGTTQSFKTSIGSNCFIMSYVHLAHDCHVGDGAIIVNSVQLAGHVTVGEKAIIAGQCAAHQFVKIGKFSFVGGCSRISQDVPPYVKAVGNPMKLYGLNSVGLQRNNFPEEVVRELKRAYRLFFRSELNVTQAKARVQTELNQFPEVQDLIRFVEESGRGVAG